MTDQWLRLQIDGPDGRVAQAQFLTKIRDLPAGLMREAMWSIGHIFRRLWMARQFQQEGRYFGSGWARLTPQYLRWKIEGGWFEDIGKRTGAMVQAMTNKGATVSLSGPYGSSVRGIPKFTYDAEKVTVGASVTEDGREYAEHFNTKRHIMGEGRMPQEVELEGAKVASMPHLAAMHGSGMGDPKVDDSLNVRPEIRQFVRRRLLKEAEGAVA